MTSAQTKEITMTPEEISEKIEATIVALLETQGSVDQATATSPKTIFAQCKEAGFKKEDVEAAIVRLIDKDVIEYEMDANNQATEIWLLDEEF